MTKGFVLLSGGIDSTTALTLAVNQLGSRALHCVSVDYGQRHRRELDSAAAVANFYACRHTVLPLDGMPKSTLTDPDAVIPDVAYGELPAGISPTYVPFRNGQMLSKIAAFAVAALGENDNALIYFGAHAEDAENWAYADCTPEFTGAMANAIFVGTYSKVRLIVPWQYSQKNQIIAYGRFAGTPYHLTWSCYKGGELHCGVCPTCRARRQAFTLAGAIDPTDYAAD